MISEQNFPRVLQVHAHTFCFQSNQNLSRFQHHFHSSHSLTPHRRFSHCAHAPAPLGFGSSLVWICSRSAHRFGSSLDLLRSARFRSAHRFGSGLDLLIGLDLVWICSSFVFSSRDHLRSVWICSSVWIWSGSAHRRSSPLGLDLSVFSARFGSALRSMRAPASQLKIKNRRYKIRRYCWRNWLRKDNQCGWLQEQHFVLCSSCIQSLLQDVVEHCFSSSVLGVI